MSLKIDTEAANATLVNLKRVIGELQGSMHALAGKIEGLSTEEWSGSAAASFKSLANRSIYQENDVMLDNITEEFEHMIKTNETVAKMEEGLGSAIEKLAGWITPR